MRGCLIAWNFEHGHRAVCGGGVVGGPLDVLECEALVEVVQSRAENRYRWGRQRRVVVVVAGRGGGGEDLEVRHTDRVGAERQETPECNRHTAHRHR